MPEPYFSSNAVKLFHCDCIEVLSSLPDETVDMIFADPPYFLSNGGISCKAGKMVSVNKADWDRSNGIDNDFEFTYSWISLCRKVLKKNGTIWISGTMHNIYQVGYALQKLNFKMLNEIAWFKPNAPPNLSCKYFTHSHETLLWARKNEKIPHFFNYNSMKDWSDSIAPKGKQMRSIWQIPLTPLSEKTYGKHPTQKPIELLKRIITSSTKEKAIILDPFNGSGTTAVVAKMLNRQYVGIDTNEEFLKTTIKRIKALNNKLL